MSALICAGTAKTDGSTLPYSTLVTTSTSCALAGESLSTGRTATDVYGSLADRIPGNDELWGDLGDAWLYVGDTARAREAYQKAATIDPGDGEWQRQLAILGPGTAQ